MALSSRTQQKRNEQQYIIYIKMNQQKKAPANNENELKMKNKRDNKENE